MTFHSRIFVIFVFGSMPVTIKKELGEFFQRLHFWNQWAPLIKMHCRVLYSFDCDLKICSGQVCLWNWNPLHSCFFTNCVWSRWAIFFFFFFFAGQSFLLEMLPENFSILTPKHAIFWKKSALVKARSMYWNIHQRYGNTRCGVLSSGIKFRYIEIGHKFWKNSRV